ncbi:MAG: hypothetical protein EHM34_07255 [Nitrosopumilales archaeon]|nr:MAG: hypothetical protein EHM34_07255 [Nitrosopumilales archaeon]
MIKQLMFEGCDRCGKSSVAQSVSKQIQWPIIKIDTGSFVREGVPIGSTNLERIMRAFNQTVSQFKDSNFILDRGFVSTQVYSKAYKRFYNTDYIDSIINNMKDTMLVVWLDSPLQHILDRASVDELNIIENQKFKLIQHYYREYFKRNKELKVLKIYNDSSRTIEEMARIVIDEVAEVSENV